VKPLAPAKGRAKSGDLVPPVAVTAKGKGETGDNAATVSTPSSKANQGSATPTAASSLSRAKLVDAMSTKAAGGGSAAVVATEKAAISDAALAIGPKARKGRHGGAEDSLDTDEKGGVANTCTVAGSGSHADAGGGGRHYPSAVRPRGSGDNLEPRRSDPKRSDPRRSVVSVGSAETSGLQLGSPVAPPQRSRSGRLTVPPLAFWANQIIQRGADGSFAAEPDGKLNHILNTHFPPTF
jgi:hypothetical protein